jgi:hypothetical protein
MGLLHGADDTATDRLRVAGRSTVRVARIPPRARVRRESTPVRSAVRPTILGVIDASAERS